ncbi:MAG TPA: P13 family porin [Spirochaetales bacterium]|nr:P13 family porin [Spirochaetales bacterium]
MKKLVSVLVLLCVAGVCFADDSTLSSVSGLIKSDLFKNQAQIQGLSKDLSSTEKMALYSEYKKDQWVPFLVNFVLGAGIGSFIEGDTTGGAIALGSDVAGLACILVGAGSSDGVGLVTVGYITLLSSRIFEIVRPFTYTAHYNSTLKQSLNYFGGLSFEPSLVPSYSNGIAGLTFACKVRLN